MAQRSPKTGLAAWKWLLLPLMLAVICMSYLWAGDLQTFQSPKTARIIFWHVPMAILSMVWFAVAAFYAGRYLWKGAEFDDVRTAKAAEVGLLLTILATVTGAVFSKMQWAGGFESAWYEGYWQWDPKQTAIVVVIVIFAAYFGLRASIEEPRKRARLSAVYAILGFAAVPVLYYILPHLPIFQSLHPTNTIREGMDVPYSWTFRLSTLTFLGVSIWAYQLQLRAARLDESFGGGGKIVDEEPRTEAVRATIDRQASERAPLEPAGAGRD